MLPVPPQRDCSFEAILILPDPHVFLFMLTSPDKKALLTLFPGSRHADIVFLGTPYFSATFDGFIPDSTSVIPLYFSESDNLFLFKLAIFHNIRLQHIQYTIYNVTVTTINLKRQGILTKMF